MKVGFIGAGKVGCSLYDYFVHNNIPITGCYTRTQAKVSGTEKQTQKIFTTSIDKILTKSDVLFLTVPDDAIAAVWELVKNLSDTRKVYLSLQRIIRISCSFWN